MRRSVMWLAVALLATASAALSPEPAHAGGIEVPARGAVALGRGGAFMARANEPLALWYNPALLADLEGFQLQLDVSGKNRKACFQRSGTHAGFAPGDGRIDRAGLSGDFDLRRRSRFGILGDYRDEGFPKVCKQNQVGINPYLVGSFRLTDELGLGFGLVSPMGSGGERWGRPDGTVMNDEGELRPSPARYMRFDADTSLVRVGLGVGWAPTDWLRLGGSFFNAFFWGSTTSYTAVLGGERPSLDVEAKLGELGDNFIPGGTVSAHFIPHDRLDIGVSFFASDAIDADGRARATVAQYGFTRDSVDTSGSDEEPAFERASAATITTEQKFPVNLRVPQPWSLDMGIRYAHPRGTGTRDRADRDPMRDEVFDIELDVGLVLMDRINRFDVDTRCAPGTTGDPELCDRSDPDNLQPRVREVIATPNPTEGPCSEGEAATDTHGNPVCISENHRKSSDTQKLKGFKNQVTLYLGGDWNVVPETLALRTGVSYESDGIDARFVEADFVPAQRLGLHLGFTVRAGPVDVTAAYAHLFQQDVVNEPNVAQPTGENGKPPSCPDNRACQPQTVSVPPASIVNNGKFTESWDIVTVGLVYRTDAWR